MFVKEIPHRKKTNKQKQINKQRNITGTTAKKLKNLFANLPKKPKRKSFGNWNIRDDSSNKKFRKTINYIKPWFNNKGLNSKKLLQVKKM